MVKRSLPQKNPYAKYNKRAKTTKATKTLSAAVKKAVYGLAEKKLNIVQADEVSLSTINAGADWYHLTNLTQNSSDASRVGRSVTLDSVRIRGILNNNSAASTQYVRMVIGYFNDFQVPSIATPLFEAAAGYQPAVTFGTTGASNGLNCIYQPLSGLHFTCIHDRVFTLASGSSVDAGQTKYFDITKNLRGTKITFDGTATGAGGNMKKTLYVGFWAAEAADDSGLGTVVELSAAMALKYTDL